MSFLVQTGWGTGRPVTIDQAKRQLRIDFVANDILIDEVLDSAMAAVSEMTGLALRDAEWEYSLRSVSGDLRLPRGPVKTLDSVKYYDSDDVLQALDADDFYLFKDSDCAIVRPKSGTAWPQSNGREDGVKISFTAGWSGVLPPEIRQAVLLLVTHFYEQREVTSEQARPELPYAVQDLVSLHRRGWVA